LRSYECILILSPGGSETLSKEKASRYARVITEGGGEMTKVDHWGKRRLAYEIKDHQEGYYLLLQFRGEPKVITELDRQLRLDEEILRHMIVKNPLATGEEAKIDIEEVQGEPQAESKEDNLGQG